MIDRIEQEKNILQIQKDFFDACMDYKMEFGSDSITFNIVVDFPRIKW